MKRSLTLLAFTAIFAVTASAQSEQVEIPKGVIYQYADDSTNAKAVAAIRKALDTGESSALFNKSVTCGPLLWSHFKVFLDEKHITGTDTIFKVPQYHDQGKVSGHIGVTGKVITDSESFNILWTFSTGDTIPGGEKPSDTSSAMQAFYIRAEVLSAFKLVNDGMRASNNAIDEKNAVAMRAFENSNARAAALMNDAQRAQELAEEFVKEVEEIRRLIIHESGGYVDDDTSRHDLVGKRNVEVPTTVMVEEGKGAELKNSIDALRDSLLALPALNDSDKAALKEQFTLSTYYNLEAAKQLGKDSWEEYMFDHVPVIAINTILTKFQGDSKNSAGLVYETLLKKLGPSASVNDSVNNLTIRKLSPEELSLFAAISSPGEKPVIKEPLYIIDSGNLRLLLQFSDDMKVRWIELMP